MGVLYAKVAGEWVPISTSSGGGGTDEVWVGSDDPIAANPTIEMWYDPDAPSDALAQVQAWNSAWGILGVATVIASTDGITSTGIPGTAIAGASVTATIVAGRKTRIRWTGHPWANSAAQSAITNILRDGAIIQQRVVALPHAGYNNGVVVDVMDNSATPGPHTYTVSMYRFGGTGNINMAASPGQPCELTVEDLGPVNPGVMPPNPTPAWIPVPYINGWRDIGSGFAPSAYRKVGDMVQLRGYSIPGTAVTIFTLPVGYRPPGNMEIACSGFNGTARIINSMSIKSDGSCVADQLFGLGYSIEFSVTA